MERFTQRARRVLSLAREEAERGLLEAWIEAGAEWPPAHEEEFEVAGVAAREVPPVEHHIAGPGEPLSFHRDVRPILSDHCYECHGPDVAVRQAGLRLDQGESALGVLPSGRRALVPGSLERSQLFQRIAAADALDRMPPLHADSALSEGEIEILGRFILQGAEFEDHWAYRPPRRSDPPAVAGEGWARGDIDRFVLSRLESAGLAPAPEADRRTLARRLSLDLTGLPPTPREVAAFLADASRDAYERLVDRLLASERYGEHMARSWLDAARYADTNGYHIDNERMVYFIFSQGFRLGGHNSQRAAATGLVPLRYDSDRLNNFEAGLKSTWFDRRMQLNLSAFYMEWQDIQIDNAGGVDDVWWLRGNTNGDTAETKGVELYWAAQFSDSFSLEGSLFAADPQFTSDFTTINGDEITDGTVMPISPKYKVWLAAEYTFHEFMGRGDLWVRIDYSRQGKVYDSLYSAIMEAPDGVIPSWSYSNLQAGMEFYNNWNMTLSVWNLFDQRIVNWIDDGYNDQAIALGDPRFRNLLTYEKPRTIGISVTKWFGS